MKRGLVAAGGLVAAANLIVLLGVAYNRSRVVARVELTESELTKSYTNADNTGIALQLQFIRPFQYSPFYTGWFTESMLKEAGFAVPASAGQNARTRTRPPVVAFLALEMDGPALHKWREEAEARRQALPPAQRGGLPRTRLIAVEVARDPERLTRKYADASKYLIARAAMTITWSGRYQPEGTPNEGWQGYISELLPNNLHVPLAYSEILRPLQAIPQQNDPRYAVTVAIGRRYEPWIESVRLIPVQP